MDKDDDRILRPSNSNRKFDKKQQQKTKKGNDRYYQVLTFFAKRLYIRCSPNDTVAIFKKRALEHLQIKSDSREFVLYDSIKRTFSLDDSYVLDTLNIDQNTPLYLAYDYEKSEKEEVKIWAKIIAAAKKWIVNAWSTSLPDNCQIGEIVVNPAIELNCDSLKKFNSAMTSLNINRSDFFKNFSSYARFGVSGTKVGLIPTICHQNYLPKLRKGQIYGVGEYFTDEKYLNYSLTFSNYNQVFVAIILNGNHFSTQKNGNFLVVNNPTSDELSFQFPLLLVITKNIISSSFPLSLSVDDDDVDDDQNVEINSSKNENIITPIQNQDNEEKYKSVLVTENGVPNSLVVPAAVASAIECNDDLGTVSIKTVADEIARRCGVKSEKELVVENGASEFKIKFVGNEQDVQNAYQLLDHHLKPEVIKIDFDIDVQLLLSTAKSLNLQIIDLNVNASKTTNNITTNNNTTTNNNNNNNNNNNDKNCKIEVKVLGPSHNIGKLLNFIHDYFTEHHLPPNLRKQQHHQSPSVQCNQPKVNNNDVFGIDCDYDADEKENTHQYCEMSLTNDFLKEDHSNEEELKELIRDELATLLGIDDKQIVIEKLIRGSTHIVFAILPSLGGKGYTTKQIIRLLKTYIADPTNLSNFTYLSSVDASAGISVTGSKNWANIIAEAKKWIQTVWPVTLPISQQIGDIDINPAIDLNCDSLKKFHSALSNLKYESQFFTNFSSFCVFGAHGTNKTAVPSICHDNFLPTYRRGQAFGPGEYFTVGSCISYSIGIGDILVAILLKCPNLSYQNNGNYLVMNNPTNGSMLYQFPLLVITTKQNLAQKVQLGNCCAPPKPPTQTPKQLYAVLVDPKKQNDTYYGISVVGSSVSVQSWDVTQTTGQTGSPGITTTLASGLQYPQAVSKMHQIFAKNTKPMSTNSSTAVNWKLVPPPPNSSAIPVIWQFWIDCPIDDYSIGWHNFFAPPQQINPNVVMEGLYNQWLVSPMMGKRYVQSGYFTREVNFNHASCKVEANLQGKRDGVQENTQTHKIRSIRRADNANLICRCKKCAI